MGGIIMAQRCWQQEDIYEAVEACLSVDVEQAKVDDKARVLEIAVCDRKPERR